MKPQAFLAPQDMSLAETRDLLAVARNLQKNPLRRDLAGKTIGMIFFNPSLRTRTSFDVAMNHLGGHAVILNVGGEGTWTLEYREDIIMDGDKSEHIKEAAQVLSRYVDAIAIRAFSAGTSWEEDRREQIHRAFAAYATVPVINMESQLHHPCQSLADIKTIEDRIGDPAGQPLLVTWGWHPNPLAMAVPNSIVMEAAKFGMEVRLAHPPGWELDSAVIETAGTLAEGAGGSLRIYNDFEEALPGARAVYAKSWGSITHYGDPQQQRAAAAPYRDKWRVTLEHMERTDNAFFLHCLPIRRGIEADAAVLDAPCSAVYDEAENRLHVQKAVLLRMLA